MQDYRRLSSTVQGTLGLVTLNGDVFLCVVNGSRKVASVRPGETIQVILSVEFHCLNRSDYDHLLHDQVNPFPTDDLDANGYDYGDHRDSMFEHPCMALKKLLSGGSFYYSADFDLTKRVQDRSTDASTVAIDSLDGGFLWNGYMIQPLVDFRSKLSPREKSILDHSRILTSAIRGYAATVAIPASSSPARLGTTGMPSTMTMISRLSCRRAGTRFNARGIDDDGNVANFSETETIFITDNLCYSYVQCRGSVPLFWEQQVGLPGQQKIQILGSPEASQFAFNKHFQKLSITYGDIVAVNLLSDEKQAELNLTRQYMRHIDKSPLNHPSESAGEPDHKHVTAVNYDFHAATKGPAGYEAASGIKAWLFDSAVAFEYFLAQDMHETITKDGRQLSVVSQNDIVKQNGVFRTNCLDCLDRTNVAQEMISKIALNIFLHQQGEPQPVSDFWARHGMLWADNGDALAKIYTGTGALKTSFTRSGKSSFAGALADLRKSAQRLYVNTVEDKGRQVTIDMLLGRLIGQTPVHLYDPINEYVTAELSKRSAEYTSTEKITIWVGTFNLNGKTSGIDEDLSPWLCPDVEKEFKVPEIVAVAFQEIVDLDVQQIMSTDPDRRKAWESAVRRTLNRDGQRYGGEDYVLLRGGQLVGASLSIFVRASALPMIKNVEGAVKKTGLSGMAGNKGAVAIRLDYADTSICLVTAHLAAGFQNYDERNQDYRTIANGIRFQTGRTIEEHKSILWFGDFNYRIGMENERARQLIRKGDLELLYENDQLNINMVHGKCFPHYSEQRPRFLPTYKFDLRTDDYDTSDKSRIPAWCDRILTRGDNLRQMYYDSAPLKFSDHRPVWGIFTCAVSVVDQVKKDSISGQLYIKRRAAIDSHLTNNKIAESDDESLYGYDSIDPGLPPASSDKRKWWLDNGNPARSTVQLPTAGAVLNPARPSNPYTPTNEPDWVTVETPDTPPQRNAALYFGGQQAQGEGNSAVMVTRKPPPPSSSSTSQQQNASSLRPANMAPVAPALTKQPTGGSVLRKPAPPPKPRNLRSPSPASSVASSTQRSIVAPTPPDPRRSGTVNARNMMPPPPRRTNSGALEAKTPLAPPPPLQRKVVGDGEHGDVGPALPPRRSTTGATATVTRAIMDDDRDDEHGNESLHKWQPLEPERQ